MVCSLPLQYTLIHYWGAVVGHRDPGTNQRTHETREHQTRELPKTREHKKTANFSWEMEFAVSFGSRGFWELGIVLRLKSTGPRATAMFLKLRNH